MGEVAAAAGLLERAPERFVALGHDSRTAQLEALRSATAELAQVRAVERLPAVAAVAATRGLGADLLVFATLEEEGRRLRVLPYPGRRERSTSFTVDGAGLVAQAVRSGRAIFEPSCDGVRTLRAGTESVAVVPLPATARPVGVMAVGRSGRDGFSSDDVAFVEVLAAVCGFALERLQLLADRQVLRRRRALRDVGTEMQTGRIRIDLENLRMEVDGRSAHLTPTEMRLLMFLADEPGRPRTRGEILRHLWQTDHVGGERTCDAHIWNLRRKIERDPSRPELVVTRRGVGYALDVA